MKRALLLAASTLATAPVFCVDTLCQVVPKNCRILAEDDQVLVFEFKCKKGEKIPMHSHPKRSIQTGARKDDVDLSGRYEPGQRYGGGAG